MYSFLTRPAWLVLAVVVALATALFLRLGFWQLDRLEERRLENQVIETRLAAEPEPIADVLEFDWTPAEAAERSSYRRVLARGRYEIADEVLIRSQTNRGQAGFHVITPLSIEPGVAILVNRGWVPLDADTPPVPQRPPEGDVEAKLVLQGTETRGSIGPVDAPEGRLAVMARVDIERIAGQVQYALAPVYGLLVDDTAVVPVPVELPELTEGTHLSYAIQWFAFAAIAVGGFAALARTTARRDRRRARPAPVDAISSEP